MAHVDPTVLGPLSPVIDSTSKAFFSLSTASTEFPVGPGLKVLVLEFSPTADVTS